MNLSSLAHVGVLISPISLVCGLLVTKVFLARFYKPLFQISILVFSPACCLHTYILVQEAYSYRGEVALMPLHVATGLHGNIYNVLHMHAGTSHKATQLGLPFLAIAS